MDARILRVTPDLYPYSWGGIAVHTYLMSKYQAKSGHSVTVLTGEDSDHEDRQPDEFEVHRLPGVRDLFGNPVLPGIWRYVRRNLGDFDVVHVHSQLFFSSLFAVWARHANEIPAILTCHGVRSSAVPFAVSDLYLRTVTRATLPRVQCVLCYSEQDARLLARLTHTSFERMQVVPNGVPLEMFRPARAATEKSPVILWAGRMVRYKGLNLLLAAMKRVVQVVPMARLLLLGTGPELASVREEVERLRLCGHVDLGRDRPFEDMPRVYEQSAVCVVPSITEGMPRTLMEAAASGTPVVATQLPQLLRFAGKGVVLFEPGSVNQLADSLTKILTDADFAEQLSVEARILAEKEFSWDRTVAMTSQLCERFASPSKPEG